MKKNKKKFIAIIICFTFLPVYLCSAWENLTNQWLTIDSSDNQRIFTGISCLDKFNCVAMMVPFIGWDNFVKITEDAGNSWKYILFDTLISRDYHPDKSTDIKFIQKNKILITLDSGRILLTNNKGLKWQKIQLPTIKQLFNINFINEEKGVISSFDEIFFTLDSCKTWTKLDFELKKLNSKLKSIVDLSLTENNLFVVCSYDTILDNGDDYQGIAYYYRSDDFGKTWEKLSDTTHSGFNIQFLNENIGYASGSFKNNSRWWYHTVIYKTTDGGNSWDIVYFDPLIDYPVSSMKFYDENNGIIITMTAIFKTSDGGKNWIKWGYDVVNQLNFMAHTSIEWQSVYHPIITSGFFLFKYYESGLNVRTELINSVYSISPNPAGEYIEIDFSNPRLEPWVDRVTEIKIFNLLGECVLTTPSLRDTPSEKGNIRIDVTGLLTGIYFVRVGDWVGRFVKI